MKTKGIFFILFLSVYTFSFSQKGIHKPDFKKIKKQIKKKRSDFYYPNLVKKFTRGLPMTTQEEQYFYYGYAFFSSYKPYMENRYYKQINAIVVAKKYDENTLNQLLNLINLEQVNHPFDVKLLKIKLFAYKRLKDSKNFQIVKNQIQVIQDAILSSGNGLTPSTAYAVIFEENQHDILKFLGLEQKQKKYLNKTTEYYSLRKNSKKIKDIYFNVQLMTRRINAKKK